MKKKIRRTVVVLIAAVLLFPVPGALDDGGTLVFDAALYSVRRVRQLEQREGEKGRMVGVEVQILGVEVYNDVRFVPAQGMQEGA